MNLRLGLTITYSIAGLALAASLIWVVVQFLMPGPVWVAIGPEEDFQPSTEPYAVRDVYVFLVNNGQEISVLDPLNPAPGGTNVRWIASERAFIDPLRGTRFDLFGMPKRSASSSLMEAYSLRFYDVKIENGLIYIDLTRPRVIRLAGGSVSP